MAVTTLAYRPESVSKPLDGAGFLVPRVDGRLMTACTFTTTKWPSTAAASEGMVLVRASAGRAGDDRPDHLDDTTLVAQLHDELAEAIGVTDQPVASLVSRWPNGFPQYQPGHAQRVDRIEAVARGRDARRPRRRRRLPRPGHRRLHPPGRGGGGQGPHPAHCW